ncbi:hypothetical protein CN428_24485 [Bacillus cereus]|nr:hypothetical protein CN428_24485 [Bacillus cereus]
MSENIPENTNNNQNELKYPSGEMLLSIIQKEYDYESARKSALETRSGVLITLAAAILTFTFSNVKLPKIKTPINDFPSLIFYVSYFLIAVVSVVTVVISLCYLMRVIFIAEYKRFETETLNTRNGKFQPDIVAMSLTEQYQEIISHNQLANNKKTDLYRKGTNYMIISLFASVILYGIALNL